MCCFTSFKGKLSDCYSKAGEEAFSHKTSFLCYMYTMIMIILPVIDPTEYIININEFQVRINSQFDTLDN